MHEAASPHDFAMPNKRLVQESVSISITNKTTCRKLKAVCSTLLSHISTTDQTHADFFISPSLRNRDYNTNLADHRLGIVVTVVSDKGRVAADDSDRGRAVEGPLAVGRVRESVVEVGAAACEDLDVIVGRHSAAQRRFHIGADVNFQGGESGTADAGTNAAVDDREGDFFLEACVVAEDHADLGVGLGLAADGRRAHDARGGQEGSDDGGETHCVVRVLWLKDGLLETEAGVVWLLA